MKEIWKDIKGYEGKYQVSNLGNVRSLNNFHKKGVHLLNKKTDRYGYKEVHINYKGTNKYFTIHRLVAQAFIPNPNNLPCINHKNENKEDNRASNLEWCSYKYNNNYGTRLKKISIKMCKKIRCIETNKIYKSLKDASIKTKISVGNICQCANGKYKQAGGFHWEYIEG